MMNGIEVCALTIHFFIHLYFTQYIHPTLPQMPPTPPTLPYGIGAELIGTLFIIISITCLKHFKVGLVYELTLMLGALFTSSLAIWLYYRFVRKPNPTPAQISSPTSPTSPSSPPTSITHSTDHTFHFTDLFTDPLRLEVGLYTFGYFLLMYSSYRLLPITIAMPIFVTYPVMDILLSSVIDKTPGPDAKQWVAIVVLLAGVGAFLYNATSTVVTPTIVIGIVCGFLGALSISLRMIYTAHRPVMGAPVRPVGHVLKDHPEHAIRIAPTQPNANTEGFVTTSSTPTTAPTNHKPLYTPSLYHLSIQMLETSTVGMLCFVVLTVILMCMPQSWLTYLTRTLGVPESILSRSTDGGCTTMLLAFCIYAVFTFWGNALLIASDDMLPTNIYACLVYSAVVFSMASGYFVLGETVSVSKWIGLLLVVVGGVGIVWWKRDIRSLPPSDHHVQIHDTQKIKNI